jgi:Protein of unknown function (DUF2442)
MIHVTDAKIAAAERRGAEAEVREARAVAVRYDHGSGNLVLALRGGTTLIVPTHLLQGVAGASPELIAEVELAPRGAGLHWEKLDADLLVQDIVAGCFGTARWMAQLAASGQLDTASLARLETLTELRSPTAAEMGRKGGSARTLAKAIAARANAARGGRPRKTTAKTKSLSKF